MKYIFFVYIRIRELGTLGSMIKAIEWARKIRETINLSEFLYFLLKNQFMY